MSEDAEKEAEAEVQKLTDKNVKRVDEIVAVKEKEIMVV
jgi:ribosome recycling factor